MLELAKLTQDILPPGVFNVITGKGSKSGEYILHRGLCQACIYGFDGSWRFRCASGSGKTDPGDARAGRKICQYLFPDCDWEMAMEGVQLGILFNQGRYARFARICTGRYLRPFIEDAVQRFDRVKVGEPWKEDTQMGAQISKGQLKKVLDYIEIGKQEGAKVACGGVRITENGLDKGYFMRPTLLVDVKNDMRVAQEEIFGPVAVVIKFKTEDEVIGPCE